MNEINRIKNINEDKLELISTTIHQLRTSLSALKWTLKILLDKDLGDINNDQENYIRKAISSNERAISIVNYLLTLSHSDDIQIRDNFKQTNVVHLIEKVINTFSEEIKYKDIFLVFNKPNEEIPLLNCDEEMITDVIQNLIENSIKYNNNGGSINISIKVNLKNIEISFHDNGIGIEEKDQSQIFNKFFRAPNAIEKEMIGSGLGLFMSKNIAQNHNGDIWFESSNDRGTTFFLSLPIN